MKQNFVLFASVWITVFLTYKGAFANQQQLGTAEGFFNWYVAKYPEVATNLNIHKFDETLFDLSLNSANESRWQISRMKEALKEMMVTQNLGVAIQNLSVSHISSLNLEALNLVLDDMEKTLDMIMLEASETPFPLLWLDLWLPNQQHIEPGHYSTYSARLKAFAIQMDQFVDLIKENMKNQRKPYSGTVRNWINLVGGILENNATAEQTPFWMPYLAVKLLPMVNNFAETGKSIIEKTVLPKLQYVLQELEKYNKTASPARGLMHRSGGNTYYEALLRWHTSETTIPADIHANRQKKVIKLHDGFNQVRDNLGYIGATVSDFLKGVRNDTAHLFEYRYMLIDEYESKISMVESKLDGFFTPEIYPLQVLDSIGSDELARYHRSVFQEESFSGLLVGTKDLKLHPRFVIPAVVMRDTFPGRHMQFATSAEFRVHPFRVLAVTRHVSNAPLHFPSGASVSGYIEGWAMYAMSLGEEMGVYESDYDKLGYLYLELHATVSCVVDTGIHAMNWTDERAQQYIDDVLGVEYGQSIITTVTEQPGRSCAGPVGEEKFQELRAELTKALGSDFNTKDFHDFTLALGPMPLDLLSRLMQQFCCDFPQPLLDAFSYFQSEGGLQQFLAGFGVRNTEASVVVTALAFVITAYHYVQF